MTDDTRKITKSTSVPPKNPAPHATKKISIRSGRTSPTHPRISVVGRGGAGANGIHRLMEMGALEMGFDLCVVETDEKHLVQIPAPRMILIGGRILRSLGTGGDPELGRRTLLEEKQGIMDFIGDSKLVFVVTSMGGGTGTGASPVVARLARDQGALTLGMAYLPFEEESGTTLSIVIQGLPVFRAVCDQVFLFPNRKLSTSEWRTDTGTGFRWMDEQMLKGMMALAYPLLMPALVRTNREDLRLAFQEGAFATMGYGQSEGKPPNAPKAAERALRHRLLADYDLKEARGAIVSVIGDGSLQADDAESAVELVTRQLNPGARVVWSAVKTISTMAEGTVGVCAILTGLGIPRLEA